MSDERPPVRLPRSGSTIAGRYRLERRLAAGGMGVVYEATDLRDPSLGRVAVKVLRPEVVEMHDVLERFQREAELAQRIDHPNVVRTLDAGATEDRLPYMVMELLHGRDASDELKRTGPFPIELAVHVVRQAARGVAAAHALRIIHRDVKPSNLFLLAREGASSNDPDRDHPIVKVLDFGVSKALDTETHVTATNLAVGTPLYMAPEQIRSAKSVDARADVWSLGVILFQLLTKRTPFEGESAPAVAAAIVADEPLPLAQLRPDAPPGLVAVVMHLLRKNVAQRAASAEEVIERLAPFDGIENARASTAVFAAQPRRWKQTVRMPAPSVPGAQRDSIPIAPSSSPGLAPNPSHAVHAVEHPAHFTPAAPALMAPPAASTTPGWTNPRPASLAPAPAQTRSPLLWIVAASIFLVVSVLGVVLVVRSGDDPAAAAASSSKVAETRPTDAPTPPSGPPMIAPAPIRSAEPAPSLASSGGEGRSVAPSAEPDVEPTPSADPVTPSATVTAPPSAPTAGPYLPIPKKTCPKSKMILVGGKLVCP